MQCRYESRADFDCVGGRHAAVAFTPEQLAEHLEKHLDETLGCILDENGQPEIETDGKGEAGSHALGIGTNYAEEPPPEYICEEPFTVEKEPITQGWDESLSLEFTTNQLQRMPTHILSTSPLLLAENSVIPELEKIDEPNADY